MSVLGTSGYEIYIFLEKKWLNYLQTVEILIRRHILRPLIWVCTVCQLPFYGSPDYKGIKRFLWIFYPWLFFAIRMCHRCCQFWKKLLKINHWILRQYLFTCNTCTNIQKQEVLGCPSIFLLKYIWIKNFMFCHRFLSVCQFWNNR